MKKIFIVDDDPVVTAMLGKIMKDLGFNDVLIFSDGASCLERLEEVPNVIFLDYQMENMNGLEVLAELKKNSCRSAVVFTTALEDLSIAMQSIAHGSIEFLLKKNISKKEVHRILSELDSY